MNTENSMVIGNPYPDTWELNEMSSEEIQERFKEYVISELDSNEVSEFFMQFIEDWAQAELYGFYLNGTMHKEFIKWLAGKFEQEFADENDINPMEINGFDIVKDLV